MRLIGCPGALQGLRKELAGWEGAAETKKCFCSKSFQGSTILVFTINNKQGVFLIVVYYTGLFQNIRIMVTPVQVKSIYK